MIEIWSTLHNFLAAQICQRREAELYRSSCAGMSSVVHTDEHECSVPYTREPQSTKGEQRRFVFDNVRLAGLAPNVLDEDCWNGQRSLRIISFAALRPLAIAPCTVPLCPEKSAASPAKNNVSSTGVASSRCAPSPPTLA